MKRIALGMIAALTLGGCTEFMDGYNHAKYGTPLPAYAPAPYYYAPPAPLIVRGPSSAVTINGFTTFGY